MESISENRKSQNSDKDINAWIQAHVSPAQRVAFVTALISGLMAHFILLSHGMMSQDGLTQSIMYHANDFETAIGRWGIQIFERLRFGMAVSYLSGIICIFVVAFATMIILRIFEIESRFAGFVTACFLEMAPALVVTMLYEYTADLYMYSLLFAIIAVYFITQQEGILKSAVPGIVFTVLALSLYQSYIGIIVGTCMMVTLVRLLRIREDESEDSEEADNTKTALLDFLSYVIKGFFGFVAYFICTKLVQAFMHIDAGEYNGVNNMSIEGIIKGLPQGMVKAYKGFAQYFFRDSYVLNTNWHRDIFYGILFVAITVLVLTAIITKKVYQEIPRLIAVLLLGLLLPVGINFIALIIPSMNFYALTSMQMVMVIPFLLALLEQCIGEKMKWFQMVAVAMLVLLIPTYLFADILSYRTLQETYDQSLYGANRILERMEADEDYVPGMPVIFTGWFNDTYYPQDRSYWEYSLGYLVTNRTNHGDYYANNEAIRRFYLQFLGVQLNFADADTYRSILETEEYQEMGVYPTRDSVKVIQGVMVVRMDQDAYIAY